MLICVNGHLVICADQNSLMRICISLLQKNSIVNNCNALFILIENCFIKSILYVCIYVSSLSGKVCLSWTSGISNHLLIR